MFINFNKYINMTGMWNNVHQKHTAEQHRLHNSIIYILKTREVKGSAKTFAHMHNATTKSENTMNRNYRRGVEEAHGGSYVHWSEQMRSQYSDINHGVVEHKWVLCAPAVRDESTYASIYHVVWRVSAVAQFSIPLTYRNNMYFLASINISK